MILPANNARRYSINSFKERQKGPEDLSYSSDTKTGWMIPTTSKLGARLFTNKLEGSER